MTPLFLLPQVNLT